MPFVQLSRTCPDFVRELFALEVPEIATGDVVIKNIAREAGHRTKLSVMATRSDIDPVGACVGAGRTNDRPLGIQIKCQ